MKKYIYITGIISANLMFLGSIFKVQHWPGASILLVASIFTLCALFLPFALYHAYQNSPTKKYKATYIVTYIVFSIVFIGALFKIGHLPGAGWLMVIGIPLPIVVFLPVYLFQTRKDKKFSMTNFMGIMFGLTFLAVMSSMLSISVNAYIYNEYELKYISNQSLIDEVYESNLSALSDSKISDQANNICESIKVLKKDLLLASGNKTDSLSIRDLKNHSSLIASKEVFCIREGHNLNLLKNQIIEFKQGIETSTNTELKALSQEILNVEDVLLNPNSDEPVYSSWEAYNFRNINLIMAIDLLTRIERNVRFIQNEF